MVPYSESYIILLLAIAAGVRVVHEPAVSWQDLSGLSERWNYKSKSDRKMHEGTLNYTRGRGYFEPRHPSPPHPLQTLLYRLYFQFWKP